MKLNRIFLPVAALGALLASCDDQKMEWATPDGHYPVTVAEMPLQLAEQIANYDYIKAYAQQYTPKMTIGLGLGADLYISDEQYRQVANDNFQMLTTGNAMKHSSVVKNDGSLDFTTIDKFLAAVPSDMQIYGHNFIWHTQQRQTYLKSLITPEVVVETGDDDVCENILPSGASEFEAGSMGGWGSWGNNKKSAESVEGAGYNGTAGIVLENNGDSNAWDAQFAYTFDTPLDMNTTYVIVFKAKSSLNGGQLQFQYQNSSTYSSQGGYNTFELTTSWQDYQFEFTPAYDDVNRIILNFGAVGATYYIDNIQFGKKIEETFTNVLGDNGKFEDGNTGGWGSWGSNKDSGDIVEGVGYNDSDCMVLKNKGDGNSWEAQFAYTFDDPLKQNATYVIQFYARCDTGAGQLQFQYQNATTYGSQGGYNTFNLSTTWVKYEYEFTMPNDDVNRIILNFGAVGDTYYIDNIKFGEKKAETKAVTKAATRAGGISYKLKTAEEKRELLLGAMESWIKGMYEHLNGRVLNYDVINEPIADNNEWRGVDGNFMGDDTTPEESTESGLNLNWDSDHFYWGYYIGKDYGVKAFEYARKYAPEGSKLFVNEYGLESSPNKLAALLGFIDYIDQNGQTVDGIGTQMHVSTSITRAEVDAMFKTLAATGKYVRVTELDVQMGTTTPSTEELAAQAETYQMIIESYKENVPEAQQSGITIWSLTDNAREHEYWLPDDQPNIFDANYGRKHAYKGVCDGLAGYDISTDFDGTMWQ
jgi:GH35 family endo-1,4-beta-xylanase